MDELSRSALFDLNNFNYEDYIFLDYDESNKESVPDLSKDNEEVSKCDLVLKNLALSVMTDVNQADLENELYEIIEEQAKLKKQPENIAAIKKQGEKIKSLQKKVALYREKSENRDLLISKSESVKETSRAEDCSEQSFGQSSTLDDSLAEAKDFFASLMLDSYSTSYDSLDNSKTTSATLPQDSSLADNTACMRLKITRSTETGKTKMAAEETHSDSTNAEIASMGPRSKLLECTSSTKLVDDKPRENTTDLMSWDQHIQRKHGKCETEAIQQSLNKEKARLAKETQDLLRLKLDIDREKQEISLAKSSEDMKSLKDICRQLAQMLENVQLECAAWRSEKESLRELVDCQKHVHDAEKSVLEKKLTLLKENCDTLTEQVENLSAEKVALLAEKEDRSQEQEVVKAVHESLTTEIASLKNKNSVAQASFDSCSMQLAELSKKHAELLKSNAAYEEVVNSCCKIYQPPQGSDHQMYSEFAVNFYKAKVEKYEKDIFQMMASEKNYLKQIESMTYEINTLRNWNKILVSRSQNQQNVGNTPYWN